MLDVPKLIRTQRLTLRPYRLSDADMVLAYKDDPAMGQYLRPEFQPPGYALRDAERFVAIHVLTDWSVAPRWAIELCGEVAGYINITHEAVHHRAVIGYSIAREQWGKGLATEAARTVIDVVFTANPSLNRIYAYADARNAGSLRVMEKLGMQCEGALRKHHAIGDEQVDWVHYGILREEWAAARTTPGTPAEQIESADG